MIGNFSAAIPSPFWRRPRGTPQARSAWSGHSTMSRPQDTTGWRQLSLYGDVLSSHLQNLMRAQEILQAWFSYRVQALAVVQRIPEVNSSFYRRGAAYELLSLLAVFLFQYHQRQFKTFQSTSSRQVFLQIGRSCTQDVVMGADDADGDDEDEDRLQIWNTHRLIGLRLVITMAKIV